MAGGMSMMIVMVVTAVSAMLMKGIAAATITVGGDIEWTIPSTPDFYTSWAAKQNFAVGDVLEFKFLAESHTVAKITLKDAYDNCDHTLDKNAEVHSEPTDITLATEGQYYFICTVGSHCVRGQKFAISIPSNGTATPPPTGSTPSPSLSPLDSTTPPLETPAEDSKDTSFAHSITAFPASIMGVFVSLAVLAKLIN